MDERIIGIAAALLVSASWAAGTVLLKKVGDELSSFAMTLFKGLVSLVLLALPLLVLGLGPVSASSLWLLGLSGMLGIAVGDTLFFEALKDLGPLSLVLLMMIGQVSTVVFAVVFLGEDPTWIKWVGIALVMAGMLVVLSANLGGDKFAMGVRGVAFGLASVLCMSAGSILMKQALNDGMGTLQATFVRMLAGTAGLFVFGLFARKIGAWMNPFREARVALPFISAIAIVTFGAFWLTAVAFKYMPLHVATPLISLEPLFVLPLAAVFLKERITWRAASGTAVSVAGVVMLCQ
ncbi:MAG: DMT family transporter [Kiritimatiellia bacterium]